MLSEPFSSQRRSVLCVGSGAITMLRFAVWTVIPINGFIIPIQQRITNNPSLFANFMEETFTSTCSTTTTTTTTTSNSMLNNFFLPNNNAWNDFDVSPPIAPSPAATIATASHGPFHQGSPPHQPPEETLATTHMRIQETTLPSSKVSSYPIAKEDEELAKTAAAKGNSKKVRANVRETGYDSINHYMKSMCNHELLNRNEEIILGREIQILTKYERVRETLEVRLERPPTYAEWAQEMNIATVADLKKQIRRSLRAKAALTESNIRLVMSIAKRYQFRGLSFQDMAQEGILGLTKACEKFDPERGFRFSTYASWWIKQSVMRAISDQGRMIRLPVHIHDRLSLLRKTERALNSELGREPKIEEIAERMNMPVDRVDFLRRVSVHAGSLEDSVKSKSSKGSAAGEVGGGGGLKVLDFLGDPDSQPDDMASYQMLKDDISRLIGTLNCREQAVVRMRYGLDDGRPKTLEEIGERFSVTRERIRQIEARALSKLRQPYRNHAVQCYITEFS